MLEIDVNIRWFAALARDEALEKEIRTCRVDFGDAEAVTHRRVGCRAASLAQDVALAGKIDEVVDGQKIGLVSKFTDQREFVFDALAHLCGYAAGVTPA